MEYEIPTHQLTRICPHPGGQLTGEWKPGSEITSVPKPADGYSIYLCDLAGDVLGRVTGEQQAQNVFESDPDLARETAYVVTKKIHQETTPRGVRHLPHTHITVYGMASYHLEDQQ